MAVTELIVYPQLKWQQPESAALSKLEGQRNCGAAGTAGLANEALHRSTGDPGFITHHAVRVGCGSPRYPDGSPAGLGTVQLDAYLQTLGLASERHFGDDVNIVKEALQAGHSVGICVHYPTINTLAPELSGQLSFKGEHFLVLKGWKARDKRKGGRNTTTAYDSLFDGRVRSWGTAPLGPQLARFNVYKEAMAQFRVLLNGVPTAIGAGKAVFIIVKPTT